MQSQVFSQQSKPLFARKGYLEPQSICHLAFKDLLSDEVELLTNESIVLDIGCGSGIGRQSETQDQIATKVKELWGVEPDVETPVPSSIRRIWRSTLEDADLPEASIDLAYAFMVMEHVDAADNFMQKLASSLKPGGVFLAATINAKCFFARVARVSGRLGIQSQVLAMARGRQAVEDYHYPAVYRMNTLSKLTQLASMYRFTKTELLTIDSNEWFPYFPRRIRGAAHVVRAIFQRSPDTYPYLFVRLTK